MIVSFAHNYIYFRPKKTGSSTIVEVLRLSLGKEDISRRTELPSDLEVGRRALHMIAPDVRKVVSQEFWDRSFKFASERHPYEKAISLAYFRFGQQDSQNNPSRRFDALLGRVVASGDYRGYPYYSIDGQPIVQEFIRHETLERDLRRVAGKLGLPVPEHLPVKKGNYRLDQRPAHEILTTTQKATIYDFCREEFELLGYER
ncbi:MAG: hypothetical protein ACJ8IR_08150 [Alphaproteobacteria bacterium]